MRNTLMFEDVLRWWMTATFGNKWRYQSMRCDGDDYSYAGYHVALWDDDSSV
ncbi:hypothetical protein N9L68_00140 [bacterium]|nr:hypothetical protein [bacterium]